MKALIIALAALSMLATFVAPANASCFWHCSSDGYGGQTCHWNCY